MRNGKHFTTTKAIKCTYCGNKAEMKCSVCGKPICREHSKDGSCAEFVEVIEPTTLPHGTLVFRRGKMKIAKQLVHYRS